MKIACIGWGSLIWNPENLIIQREWFYDGPLLCIEYTRQSINGRLTLAITPNTKPIRSLWALMATEDLTEAKQSLCIRETRSLKRIADSIGAIIVEEEYLSEPERTIHDWLSILKLDAAIWTKLPPKFKETENLAPTLEEAISYLKGLNINKRMIAEEYIRRTPKQIDTFYRREFEKEFGWTYKKTT
jgi:hypothetical protein